MNTAFNDIYRGKKVLITGHTGFKGSWLALWLTELGADVVGYSLPQLPSNPSHFELLKLPMTSLAGDILDVKKLEKAFALHQPEIVFHLAAQPLVRESYRQPVMTFETNIMGTINVLEACRKTKSVRAIVNVTSDKCYQNREQIWGYRENDPMGGDDPYSASKGAAELVAQSYRHSFFNPAKYGSEHSILHANVRAGNVIGGGDWADDRLIPDIVRARAKEETVIIRSPQAVRPWQHVLEPLSGYLHLGWKLLEGKTRFADNWNFGPREDALFTVLEVLQNMQHHIKGLEYEVQESTATFHEAGLLQVDSTKARVRLGWDNIWGSAETFAKTGSWYKAYYNDGDIMSKEQLEEYCADAAKIGVEWATT